MFPKWAFGTYALVVLLRFYGSYEKNTPFKSVYRSHKMSKDTNLRELIPKIQTKLPVKKYFKEL